jgi:hypothetical protein
MAYVYESTQTGLFNFTIPGKSKTVTLFKGSKVTVDQKLTGGYLRVLRLVGEVPDVIEPVIDEVKSTAKQQAKVEDKITKVEEVADVTTDTIAVEVEDSVVTVAENNTETQEVKNKLLKKR